MKIGFLSASSLSLEASARCSTNGAAADRTPESRGPTQPITVASFHTTTVLSDDGASSSRKSGIPVPGDERLAR